MEDEIDDLNVPKVKPIGFKKKIVKKNAVSRRRLLNELDEDVPKVEIKSKPNFRKTVTYKKKIVGTQQPVPIALDLQLEENDEFNPIIENIDDIDNFDIVSKLKSKSPPPVKKYVPIVSTSTDFVAPTIKQYKQEYDEYDAEDITETNDKPLEEDNVEIVSDDANEGELVANQTIRPNQDMYDMEINDEDDMQDKLTDKLILSLEDQIKQINLNCEKSLETKLKKESELKQVQLQLEDIESRKEELLRQLHEV